MGENFSVDKDNDFAALTNLGRRRAPLSVAGKGNSVSLGEGAGIDRLDIKIAGSNNKLIIGKNCQLRGQILIKGNGQTVSIGDHTTFADVYLLCAEGCNINIGRWCMFSRKIEVRVTDAHSLIEVSTGNRVNMPRSIIIGDHVWVSLGVIINKGVTIADDNIIGAGAFVNKSFTESQTVIAGLPAEVVKRGLTWNRLRRSKWTEEEMNAWKQTD